MSLEVAMRAKALKDQDVADLLGCSRPHVTKLRRGVQPPSLPLALKIHKVFGVKMGPLDGATEAEIRTLARHVDRLAA